MKKDFLKTDHYFLPLASSHVCRLTVDICEILLVKTGYY